MNWIATEMGVLDKMIPTEESGFDKGYREAVREAASGRLNADGCFSQEQLAEAVKAAQTELIEHIGLGLNEIKGNYRLPGHAGLLIQKIKKEVGCE